MILSFDRGLKLGRNFELGEFLVSSRAPTILDNVVLSEHEIMKFYWLVTFCLQPLRDKFGRIEITSGYRNLSLNEMVGGVPYSQHLFCEAADFIPREADAEEVYYSLQDWPGEVGLYPDEHRLHVALPRPKIVMDHYIKKTRKTVET